MRIVSPSLQQVNGDSLSLPLSAELDNLKADILREIRTEVQKAKQEILDGECGGVEVWIWPVKIFIVDFPIAAIKLEFNRR